MPRARDEPVRLTRIYTRGGDAGETSLGDGSRVSKLDARIEAFGTVDELNAALGVVLAGDRAGRAAARPRAGAERALRRRGRPVGALPASRAGCGSRRGWSIASSRTATASTPISPSFEASCFPAGTAAAAGLHVARTICRRAERDTLRAAGEHELDPLVAVYLNRLSDLLFILARAANALAGHDEPLWKPGATRG